MPINWTQRHVATTVEEKKVEKETTRIGSVEAFVAGQLKQKAVCYSGTVKEKLSVTCRLCTRLIPSAEQRLIIAREAQHTRMHLRSYVCHFCCDKHQEALKRIPPAVQYIGGQTA